MKIIKLQISRLEMIDQQLFDLLENEQIKDADNQSGQPIIYIIKGLQDTIVEIKKDLQELI